MIYVDEPTEGGVEGGFNWRGKAWQPRFELFLIYF